MIKHQHKDSVTFIPRAQLRRNAWDAQVAEDGQPIFEDGQPILEDGQPMLPSSATWAVHLRR